MKHLNKKLLREHGLTHVPSDFYRWCDEDIAVYKSVLYGPSGTAHPRAKACVELVLTSGTILFVGKGGFDFCRPYWMQKCRANRLRVKTITRLRSHKPLPPGYVAVASWGSGDFVYTEGAWVTPRKPFYRQPETCASGIHFFFTRAEAIRW